MVIFVNMRTYDLFYYNYVNSICQALSVKYVFSAYYFSYFILNNTK